MASLSLGAASPAAAKLLVGIVVDGLDGDCLDLLRQQLGRGGFRLLQERGVVIPEADYGTYLDAAAATSTVVTGAAPSVSGVGAAEIFDRNTLRCVPVYSDPAVIGNYTNAAYSPAALRVSTVADEARIASGGTNVVYAVAPDPAGALALAGHAANAAIWIDAKTGNWASSTFYKDMPVTVATRNRLSPLSSRLDTISWTPLLDPADYPGLPDHLSRYPFRHVFPRARAERLDMFANSPLVNTEVSAVATDLINNLKVGSHPGVTDVLNIGYTLEPYRYGKNPDNRPEQLDAYIRLDRDLEKLFATIDRRVGLDSTVVVLASTPRRPRGRRDDDRWAIPYGEFSTRKAASLLNIYLMAIYGNGDFVSAYHNGRFFLNHKLIKERSLDLRAVRAEAADFLTRMTGVDRVYTIDDILAGRAGEHPEALRRNTVKESAGDLLVDITPGFEIVDDYNTLVAPGENLPGMVYRMAPATAPAYIMAPSLAPQTIGQPVDVRTIAPTVARILRIRSPNGASVAPLSLEKR